MIAVMKHKRLALGLLASVCLLTPVANAQSVPAFGGSFNITGYKEPALDSPYTWCFDFTKTGEVLFPNSGTWKVPSYAEGWSGTWYQDGDEASFKEWPTVSTSSRGKED
jgi:hypothetical protein